jgi:retron-type reverse transcriptase
LLLERIYRSFEFHYSANQDPPKHGDLIKIASDPDILRIAYNKLSKNKGSLTPGSKGVTSDSMSENTIQKISSELKAGNYKWSPVKRVLVPKPGKSVLRPLGLPDFDDKIVQEAIRMVLESIFEPAFAHYELNSGFRPKRDCATAIRRIKRGAQFSSLAIEGDIKGAYDNVDHSILIKLLSRRIKDKKFLDLIWSGLKAGILLDLIYTDSFVGVPQGGIASPILFNIYMHEFDLYMNSKMTELNSNRLPNKVTPQYAKLKSEQSRLSEKIKQYKSILTLNDSEVISSKLPYMRDLIPLFLENLTDFPEIPWVNNSYLQELKLYFIKPEEDLSIPNAFSKERSSLRRIIKKQPHVARKIFEKYILLLESKLKSTRLDKLHTPYVDIERSSNLLFYHRYADDFVIWLRGSSEFAMEIKSNVSSFLLEELKLTLSPDKTIITNPLKNKVRFLGFEIYFNKNRLITKDSKGVLKNVRTLRVFPDQSRLESRFLLKGFISKSKDGSFIPREIGWLTPYSDNQIIKRFNQFMIGFGMYYCTEISNISSVNRWIYYMYYSCIKTLATKHKISVRTVMNRYGYKDISIKNTLHRNKTLATDLRITAKYKVDNEIRFETLINYKELMYLYLIPHRNEYLHKIKVGETPPCSSAIDFNIMHKINSRTSFKLTQYCCVCGANTKLQMHHIRPLKVKGVLGSGFRGFDKIVGALNRKQIPVCQSCHLNIHNGSYDSVGLSELYDVRIAQIENHIDNSPSCQTINPLVRKVKNSITYHNFTYFNQLYFNNLKIYGPKSRT